MNLLKIINTERVFFWAFTCFLLIPIWILEFPPFGDMPQHAAQVSIFISSIKNSLSPEFAVNLFTPYILGYLIISFFAIFFTILTAIKITLSLSIFGFLFVCTLLRSECKGNPRWDWLILPTVYSFSFDWGFLNFVIGTPIALYFIFLTLKRLTDLSIKNEIALLSVSFLLFFSHIILYGFFYCLSALILMATINKGNFRDLLLRFRPLLFSMLVAIFWTYWISAGNSQMIKGIYWGLSYSRFGELLVLPYQWQPSGVNLIIAVLIIFVPLITDGRFKYKRSFLIATFGFILGFMLLPNGAFGASLIFQRFGVFFIPFWLLLFEYLKPNLERTNFIKKYISVIAVFLVILLSLLQCISRIENFQAESSEQVDFKQIVKQMNPNSKVLSLPFDQDAGAITTPVYAHFPVWYQTIKGGQVDPSFASVYHMLSKYKIENIPPVRLGFEANPSSFDWINHRGDEYDYFILRSHTKRNIAEFNKSRCPVVMIDHIGNWWLYGLAKGDGASEYCHRKKVPHHNLMFTHVYKSRVFDTSPEDFKNDQLNAKLIDLSDGRVGWKILSTEKLLELDIDFSDRKVNTDFKTIYVYSQIDAGKLDVKALFDLGSDDGLTVWHDGVEVLTNHHVLRAANWGDDKLPVNLHPGINHFLFRVNNAQGGWRLLARISAVD